MRSTIQGCHRGYNLKSSADGFNFAIVSDAISVFTTSWRTRLVVSKSAKDLQRALTKRYLGLVWGWEVDDVALLPSTHSHTPGQAWFPRLAVGRRESIDRKSAFGGIETDAYFT
jgi:hypothetical protein